MTTPKCLRIGVSHTPFIGVTHTATIGVTHTDFEAVEAYILTNLKQSFKDERSAVLTPILHLHGMRTCIHLHLHLTPASATFLYPCLPPSLTRICLCLSLVIFLDVDD